MNDTSVNNINDSNNNNLFNPNEEDTCRDKLIATNTGSFDKDDELVSLTLNDDKCTEVIPTDRYNIIYLTFYLLGCGTLLPFNFFITANDYFKKKMEGEDDLIKTFQNCFAISSLGPNFLAMACNVFILYRFSRSARMLTSLIVMMIMFALTTSLVLLDTKEWTRWFFVITLGTIVVISAFGSVLQGALFGLCGRFPPRYIQAMFAGQGLGGCVAAIASILSLAGGNDVIASAFGYFCTATFALIISLAAYCMLQTMDFVKYYTDKTSKCFCSCQCETECHRFKPLEWDTNATETKSSSIPTTSKYQYLKVFRKISFMALSAFLIFFTTLSIFPSTTARIESMSKGQNDWADKFFVPVSCFLFFNLFDYIGRCISGSVQKPGPNGSLLLILCIVRMAFLPLFVFCNVQPREDPSLTFFNHDAYPMIFMIIFALSNGYLSTLTVMYAPRLVKSQDAELASTIMAFSIVAGLATGAAFSFAISPNI